MGQDLTTRAVRRQVTAYGGSTVDVGIRQAQTGLMMHRHWYLGELLGALPWLRHMNARGNDIYVRPASEHGLVLLDDVQWPAVRAMRQDGVLPAIVVETSPGNLQVWVRLSSTAVSPEVRRVVARQLARRYGADPLCADPVHYGRLAGFTNRKPKYCDRGRYPYVLLRESSGDVAPAGARLIADAVATTPAYQLSPPRVVSTPTMDAGAFYQRTMGHLVRRCSALYAQALDLSRLDWMAAICMATRGYTAHEIERCIREHSPDIESRKRGHVEDYAQRTARKAHRMVQEGK